jgi:hypothetical protein
MPSSSTVDQFITASLKELGFTPGNPDLGLIRLENAVTQLKAKGETPVLCIDEFEGLMSGEEFDLQFFSHLRAVTHSGLVLVIASLRPLREMARSQVNTSPFFNIFTQLTLRPFSEKVAESFVRTKGAVAGFSDIEIIELLKCALEFSSVGEQLTVYPSCLQLACNMLLVDKRLEASNELGDYLPTAPNYWPQFKQRLQERCMK